MPSRANKQQPAPVHQIKPRSEGSTARLVFLAVGVLTSFTLFGYAQEKITRGKFGEAQESFNFTSALVLLQSVGNTVIAAVCLRLKFGSQARYSAGASVTEWLKPSLAYLGAHKFGLAALKYIPFPMQVVCKSCKSIPVMFGEMIFDPEKPHGLEKKLSVFIMSFGVASFTLFGKSSKQSSDSGMDAQTMMGLGLVLLALVCDGIYGPYQTKLQNERRAQGEDVTAYHLMFNMNLWQGIFSLFVCFMEQEVMDSIMFCLKNQDVLIPLGYFTAAMAVGNFFIFSLQAEFGSLTTTLTTTLRKLISVVLSVFLFGHSIQPLQWLAIAVVFLAKEIAKKMAGLVQTPVVHTEEKKKN